MRKVSLSVLNVDLDDDAVLATISEYHGDLGWSSIDGRVLVDIYVEPGQDLVCEAMEVTHRIQNNLPGARVDQVDDDLVGIPDIAGRIGVNRETVRSWVNGTRGPGAFPIQLGSLGGGTRGSAKVWRWSDVNRWLSDRFSLGDGFDYASRAEVAEINAQLMRLTYLAAKTQGVLQLYGGLKVSETLVLPGSSNLMVIANNTATTYEPSDPQTLVVGV